MKSCEIKFIFRHTHFAKTVEPVHTHVCHEIVYYLRGTGVSLIDGQEYVFKPNTYALIDPKIAHSESYDTDTDVLFFAFDMDDFFLPVKNGLYEDTDGKILSLMNQVWEEYHGRKPYFNYACNLLVSQILLLYCRENSDQPFEDNIGDSFKRAIDYINDNIHEDINVRKIAFYIGYSYDYFRHQFQKYYGMSAKEYILREKIKHIKYRLANTDDSIDAISRDYAFSNQSHLSIVFKRAVGMSPSEFRKGCREGTIDIVADFIGDKK